MRLTASCGSGRTLGARGVAVVQHQVVAVRIDEERHVADAGVERRAREPDAPGLELAARGVDVLDSEGDVRALLWRERLSLALGLPDREARLSGPDLEARLGVRAQAEGVEVEAPRALGVAGWDGHEVEFGDHACRLARPLARAGPSPTLSTHQDVTMTTALELGLDTFGDVTVDANGAELSQAQVMR